MFQGYDKAGNLLAQGTWRYEYSAQNQLIRAVSVTSALDVRYRFDVLGRRIGKRMAAGNFPGWAYGNAVYIQYGSQIIEEYDAAGIKRKDWLYGIEIDEPIRQGAPDYADTDADGNISELRLLWYLTNSMGTVKALSDEAGLVRERYVSDIWGLTTDVIGKSETSTGAHWTQVGNPWTFQARQHDYEERGEMIHVRARTLMPIGGRFLQRDPLGAWSDEATYGNARNLGSHNPANQSDPSGTRVYVISRPVEGHEGKANHYSVIVDRWNLGECKWLGAQMFGLFPEGEGNYVFPGPGVVKVYPPKPRIDRGFRQLLGSEEVLDRVMTTPCQDELVAEYLERSMKNPPTWALLGGNCQSYAKDAAEFARRLVEAAKDFGFECCCKETPPK